MSFIVEYQRGDCGIVRHEYETPCYVDYSDKEFVLILDKEGGDIMGMYPKWLFVSGYDEESAKVKGG